MATLVLSAVGASVGAGIGGSILGVTAATIGGAIGTAAGSILDSMLVSALQPGQKSEGPRLDNLRVTSATEGAAIPRLFGRMRTGGNIIWATDFTESSTTTSQGGGKGGGPSITTTTYSYSASFAVAFCEGPITGIGRIWADGEPLDLTGVTWRWYKGDESQVADTLIAALIGAEGAPAYRGTAYMVFEDLALEGFGNRIPQLSFEVFAPLADADTAEGALRAITLIPSAGEFVYTTEPVTRSSGSSTTAENVHAETDRADLMVSLDRLEALAPGVQSISLVVSWFGNDLRAGNCDIRPGVETATKTTSPQVWAVNGETRATAHPISTDAGGQPVYGGTPNDAAVVQAIQELKARGYRITFYPFILMDVPAGNTLPNPYSDNAAGVGQPALPWRGRITCSPAAGYVGTVDKTASATGQMDAFFGSAAVGDFTVSGTAVSWSGVAGDRGLRRMILHYAHLCAAAGGVDAFLIGSELVGLTTVRDSATNYPTIAKLQSLAADVSGILGGSVAISYAADWTEYFGHQPSDGSGDVFFHLDPLWADANVDFIGIDNYLPLSDWRDGTGHLDAVAGWPAVHDRAYLQSNIEGGERYDWYYTTDADRDAQIRTTILDGTYGKPWVFRPKDIRNWWSNAHRNRRGGNPLLQPTEWVPQSKPIHFTEFGCPAIDRGANQPNVFFDPKSSESAVPHFSRGWRDDAIQRSHLEATALYWADAANNPTSTVYSAAMIDTGECAAWTWDARPHPFFPALSDIWSDGGNWAFGHWLTGRLGAVSLAALVRALCARAGLDASRIDVAGLWGAIEGLTIAAVESPRATLSMLARHFGFDAVESEGVIRFAMRGRAPVASLTPDDLVAGVPEDIERIRGQETELPQVLRWSVARSDEDYDSAMVEARRITTGSARVAAESFPVAVPPEEAERRARRALMEAWTGRESAAFALPPSRLALDPGDVVAFQDGATTEFRLSRITDGEARRADLIRTDREVYDLPPGPARAASLAGVTTFGPPDVVTLDLPQLNDAHVPPRPLIALDADPWPGTVAVRRSPETSGWTAFTTVTRRARIATLAANLPAGPVSVWDRASVLDLNLPHGTLASVTDLALFAGANSFAVETAPGVWEVLQARDATLVATGRYQLTMLLRGQRGTEGAMGSPALAGARVVVLDDAITELPFNAVDIGMPWNLTLGPASKPVGDPSWITTSLTPTGASLKPFAPVHVAGHVETSGDLTLSWARRSRDPAADAWEPAEVPLLDAPEAYEVDILNGASVLRTLNAATASVPYAVADQIADWGAALSPGGTLKLSVAQLSPSLGRGFAADLTITLT